MQLTLSGLVVPQQEDEPERIFPPQLIFVGVPDLLCGHPMHPTATQRDGNRIRQTYRLEGLAIKPEIRYLVLQCHTTQRIPGCQRVVPLYQVYVGEIDQDGLLRSISTDEALGL